MVAFDEAITRIGADIWACHYQVWWAHFSQWRDCINDILLQSFNHMTEDATFLGAPPFPGPALDTACMGQTWRRSHYSSWQAVIISQDAYFNHPSLEMLSLSDFHTVLAKFEAPLRRSIQHISNADHADIQWIQASLGVKSTDEY